MAQHICIKRTKCFQAPSLKYQSRRNEHTEKKGTSSSCRLTVRLASATESQAERIPHTQHRDRQRAKGRSPALPSAKARLKRAQPTDDT